MSDEVEVLSRRKLPDQNTGGNVTNAVSTARVCMLLFRYRKARAAAASITEQSIFQGRYVSETTQKAS